MNATPHTVIGYSVIKLIGGNPLGCLLAFGSHLLADYIGEAKGIVTTKQRIVFDVIPTIILFVSAYLFGGANEVWLVLLGSIFGNMPDLIDKKLYLTILFPTKFKATNYLHKQKVVFTPKPIITRRLGYVLVLIVMFIYIWMV